MGLIPGIILALIVPLLFLGIIYESDFYQTGQFPLILKSLFSGAFTFAPATFTYIALEHFLPRSPGAIVQFATPIYEEIFKGLILLYLFRRAKFTYEVDGALYGFAIGTGFAIVENFVYIFSDLSLATMVAMQRVFSANLVHAFSSASIGITLGMFRSKTYKWRWWIPVIGWTIAIGQHMIYNILVGSEGIPPAVFFIPVIPGMLFIYYIMQLGRDHARVWIKEQLAKDSRITFGEASAVDNLASPNDVLLPVDERFGAQKTELMEKLLYLQAHLGIKRKALNDIRDNGTVHQELQAKINEMYTEIEKVQRDIGTYPMLFVRGLFTEDMISVWERMQAKIRERSVKTVAQKGGGLWTVLDERIKSSEKEKQED